MTPEPIYPNAPLALAVIEIRHPESTRELTRGELAGLEQHLTAAAPIQVTEHQTEFEMSLGPNGPSPSSNRVRPIFKFLSRNRKTSISFGFEAISVETTDYPGWDAFRAIAEIAVKARQDIAPLVGFERVGLRYIDEIRVPSEGGNLNWGDWVSGQLLPPSFPDSADTFTPVQQQSLVQYLSATPGHSLSLRYGAADGPPLVAGTPNLIRANLPDPGPYFLIDFDAAWTLSPGDDLPQLEPAQVLERADALHSPIKGLFEALITSKLREEVLEN